MVDLLLFLELVFVVILGINHLIKIHKYEQSGLVLKQAQLEKIGRILAFAGSVIVIIGPRIFGVRYKFDDNSELIYFTISTSGFLMFFIGVKFRIAAYLKPEETPNWIKTLVKLWQSFWRSE